MFDELYPARSGETPEQKTEREDQFKTINALRLASEYEATFNRRKLEQLIRAQTPDAEHQPGRLHRLLLELPWKDVFTTNYDTLLERTEVSGRTYQPVVTTTDLTTAFSPRIVKLHGSFPSHTPFIITEDDYRTYPKRFAPLVNSVQQSLIENAFVLVGFSGDDPNFLEWTGWIRDELCGQHAPIYLVGPLSLGNAQRSLLQQRGVTPIDLSPVFVNINPPNGFYAAALEWFLLSLLAGKPQRPEKWPDDKKKASVIEEFRPKVLDHSQAIPENVEMSPGSHAIDDELGAKVLKRWQFERKSYPGWLVLSDEKRSSLWIRTERWLTPLIKYCEEWPAVDRILLFREINWRLELSMVPLFPEWMAPFEKAVDELYLTLKNRTPVKPTTQVIRNAELLDSDLTEAWLEIAFGLLREARETYNIKRLNSLKAKIDSVVIHCPQFADRSHYEQALWHMWNVERNEVKRSLAQWEPSTRSPLASIWKAGLLAEIDELVEARSLLRSALKTIRKAVSIQGRNIELLSLEGWCTYLLFNVEHATDFSKAFSIRQEFFERWQELKAWDCDPRPIKDYFEKIVKATPNLINHKQLTRGFDPGEIRGSYNLIGNGIAPFLPAFACIRLYEQAGIPMFLSRAKVSGDALVNACQCIDSSIGYWSPAILVRAGKLDAFTSNQLMGRVHVAAMEVEIANNLYCWALKALKRELATLNGGFHRGTKQESLLGILPEVFSRLAFRVDSGLLKAAFPVALEYSGRTEIQSHNKLPKTCETWFQRLFTAADDRQRLEWLPFFITAPLDDGIDAQNNQNTWLSYFPSHNVNLEKTENNDLIEKIHTATDWLLKRTESVAGETRKYALLRLLNIFYSELMTESQKSSFGELLWENKNSTGLPDLPTLYCFIYVFLPTPENVDVIKTMKTYLLDLTPVKSVSVKENGAISIGINGEDKMIHEVASATKPRINFSNEPKEGIVWSPEETMILWGKIFEWWENEKVIFFKDDLGQFEAMFIDGLSITLKNIGNFLARAILPNKGAVTEDDFNAVFAFLDETRKFDIFLTMTLPYTLINKPEESDRITKTITNDLLLGCEQAVVAASEAVYHWCCLASEKLVENPPKTVLDHLVKRVIYRQKKGVINCLDYLIQILSKQPKQMCLVQVSLIVSSLNPWRITLTSALDNGGEFSTEECPDLLTVLGILASTLSIWLKENNPTTSEPTEIIAWRELCQSSPLPEVRRAFDVLSNLTRSDT
jgi:hypothetical protein